jgi:imidazole glycerol-phosphate synthase subunit HisF
MLKTRVVPCLLLKDQGLVKTARFKRPVYVGDPINAVRIFNEKEVDELIFLDIQASKDASEPNYDLIKDLSTECFMPFSYGGGIKNLEQIRKILKLGVEKVVINKAAIDSFEFVKAAAREFGSSTIIVAIDIKKNIFGTQNVYDHVKSKTLGDPIGYAKEAEDAGAGELFINNVDRDGMYSGYDIQLLKKIVDLVSIPVIACGGASSLEDFKIAVKEAKVSAVSAGSLFVFQGPHKAVLISYPNYNTLTSLFK